MKPKRTDRPSKPAEPGPRQAPAVTPPVTPIDLDESVAGEEDPGASLDTAIGPAPDPNPGDAKP
jgi:hypothetical protein